MNPLLGGFLQVSWCVPEIMPRMGSLPGDSMQQRLCLLTINKNLQKCELFYPNPLPSSKHRQRFLCFEMATERICSTNKDLDEKERTDKSINFECGRRFGSSSRLQRFRFLCPRLSSCLEFEMFFFFFSSSRASLLCFTAGVELAWGRGLIRKPHQNV